MNKQFIDQSNEKFSSSRSFQVLPEPQRREQWDEQGGEGEETGGAEEGQRFSQSLTQPICCKQNRASSLLCSILYTFPFSL